MLVPIVIMLFTVLIGGGLYYFLIKKGIKKKQRIDVTEKTANEFVNVRDIKDKYLYTLDNQILCYVKITPISIDLFSKNEKKSLIKMLTAEMSRMQIPFKFIAVSRPVDIAPLISELTNLAVDSDDEKQKELLVQEIMEMSNFAMSGEVVERQFYLVIWSKVYEDSESDVMTKARELVSTF
jgi:hypothetical protein